MMYDVEIICVNNNTRVAVIASNVDETEANYIAEQWNEKKHRLIYHAQIVPAE